MPRALDHAGLAVRSSVPRFLVLVAFAVLALAGVASAHPRHDARQSHESTHHHRRRHHVYWRTLARSVPPSSTSPSVSVGRANRGHLGGGEQLAASDMLHFKRGTGSDQRWGTDELCNLLRNAAEHVAAVLPGASLAVGDMSRHQGGWFRPHLSHRSGRDVDVGFYAVDDAGHPVMLEHFVRYDAHGVSIGGDHYHFDAARNWALIASLLDDPIAPVQYIFVCHRVRRWILDEGEHRHAPRALLERVATVLYQPRRGGAHRAHFHVRIYCDPSDRPACTDVAPFWGFYPYAHYPEHVSLAPVPTWARSALAELAHR